MQDFRYLFRYRDLVADTLPEHRAIAQDVGYCWWGWWKRPNEPAHTNVWDALKQLTSDGSKVRVGLFHSGTGEVHVATVGDVIVPIEDEYENLKPLSPPPDELEAIPTYYRQSSHSRAWLRIETFSESPIDFFTKYSFEESPALAGYSKSQLMRLENKRILDADEPIDGHHNLAGPTKQTRGPERACPDHQ